MAGEMRTSKDATPITCAHNRAVLDALPFGEQGDFEDATRGFISTLPRVEFRNAEGRVVYGLEDYAFLAQETAPDTVNPSLWRQARLNMNNGSRFGIPTSSKRSTFYAGWRLVPDTQSFDNGFKLQWEAFIRHVAEGAPYGWDLLEGAKGVQLVECAMRSWKEPRWVDRSD